MFDYWDFRMGLREEEGEKGMQQGYTFRRVNNPSGHQVCRVNIEARAAAIQNKMYRRYPVELHYQPKRIHCPEHGVLTEWIPWQDGKSRFLEDFNNDIAWFALNTSKTAVCTYFGINWRTVENCIEAAHDRIESDPKRRLKGLRRICVDETSWKKKYALAISAPIPPMLLTFHALKRRRSNPWTRLKSSPF